jgi:hypothetical protein
MGRRSSIIFGASLMIAATAIQTASQSVQMFIGARYAIVNHTQSHLVTLSAAS